MADVLCPACLGLYPDFVHACPGLIAPSVACIIADRDRRIKALVAEVDSWKASYMALAPDHDVAMLRANSRIEALTKALRELVEACTPLQLPSDRPLTYGVRMPEREVVDAGRAALASAAGAEGMG